jgi:uncharacterized protein YlzI (FlbEa/FlbD family)
MVKFIKDKDNDEKAVYVNPDNITTIEAKDDKVTIIKFIDGKSYITVRGSLEDVVKKIEFDTKWANH